MARKKAVAESAGSSLSAAIRQCVESGKVELGTNRGLKKALSGKAKLLVVAANCPAEALADAAAYCKLSGVPFVKFGGTSMELGTVAGRPHSVAVLAVLDAGNSGIMQFAK
jgi:large subunit ribosomal protein L30e